MKKNSGVSMITLVITIIVIIILAAVAFSASTETITNANFSDFVNNISEVQKDLAIKAAEVKGQEAGKGITRTDAQVYNYVAKGAKGADNWLTRTDATKMDATAILAESGLTLPEAKVSTPNSNGVKVTYFVTSDGTVFAWPPFVKDDGTLWVNADTEYSGDAEDIKTYSGEIKLGEVTVIVSDDPDAVPTKNMNGQPGELISGDGATVFYGAVKSANTSPVGRESASFMFSLAADGE